MIAGQAFHDMPHGPGYQLDADIAAAFEFKRARPRDFDGSADPIRPVGQLRENIEPETVVDQHPETRVALRNLVERLEGEALEAGDAGRRTSEFVGQFVELAPAASYVDVGGAGHMVAGDKNDIFCAAILDFPSRRQER